MRTKFLGVLNAAAERAGWTTPLPPHTFRGIALNEAYNTFVAAVAEVTVAADGAVRMHRIVVALDPGTVVNPLTAEMQTESAVVFGLTAALYGEITIKDGRVEQSNFNEYRMLRMAEMPRVETVLMPFRRILGRLRRTPRCGGRAGVVQCHLRGDRQAHPVAAFEEPRPEKGLGCVRRPALRVREEAMRRIDCFAALAVLCLSPSAASAIDVAPAGAAACSGCHPASRAVETPFTRLAGRNPDRHPDRDAGIPERAAARNGHGPHRQGFHRRRDQGHRGLVRGAEGLTVMTQHHVSRLHVSRRDFLRRTAATAAAVSLSAPAIAQKAGDRVVVVGGGFAGATCARALKHIDPRTSVTLVEASHDLHRLPVQQQRHCRPARPQGAAVRLQEARSRRSK